MTTSPSSSSNLVKFCLLMGGSTLLTNAPGAASFKMSQLARVRPGSIAASSAASGGNWATHTGEGAPRIATPFAPSRAAPRGVNRRGGTGTGAIAITTALHSTSSLHSTSLDYYYHTPHDEHDAPLPPDLPAPCMMGGIKYEMIPLPDSMVDTTVFVGDLDEFVTDGDLSDLFSSASTTCRAVPSVVARKVDGSSLRYGFVTFPSFAEREEAIRRLDGAVLGGGAVRVETIRTVGPRVRVPGKLVAYAVGEEKETGRRRRRGEPNTLRQISVSPPPSSGECGGGSERRRRRKKKRGEARRRRSCRPGRISTDDVLRLSRGQRPTKKGCGGGSREVPPHRLRSGTERAAFERAGRSGYVTLDGTGYRRGRGNSPLANVHRQWCDARAKPQIVLCRASGGRVLDNVVVDLSPLRVAALVGGEGDGDEGDDGDGGGDGGGVADECWTKWRAEILAAAGSAGMELVSGHVEDNTETLDVDGGAQAFDEEDEGMVQDELGLALDASAWATEPIWRLPMISVGVFEGERSKAKEMAKELSSLWETKEEETVVVGERSDGRRKGVGGPRNRKFAGGRGGGRTKMKGLREHRRR